MKTDAKEGSFELVLTRAPVEAGTTYFDTATLIKRLDPKDPKWDEKAELIKRFTHHDKEIVYSLMNRVTRVR